MTTPGNPGVYDDHHRGPWGVERGPMLNDRRSMIDDDTSGILEVFKVHRRDLWGVYSTPKRS